MERGCRAQEVALHVLSLGHHVPGVVDKRVVFLALEPFLVFWVVALASLALGLLLDGVQRDGLLHLLDGAVKVGAGLGGLGVVVGLGGVNEELGGVVVLIVVLEHLDLFLVVLLAVVIHVVARVHCMPKAAAGSVLLGAASPEERCRNY